MNNYKIKVTNGLKDKFGTLKGQADLRKKEIKINKKHRAHKKDKAELASTVKHEILHMKHPEMNEKEVYKKSRKTKMTQQEKRRMLAKLM